jgi:hypothetical protein
MAMAPPRSLAVALLLLLAAATAIPSTTCDSKNEELEDLQYLTDNVGDVPANDSDEWLQEEGFPDDDEDGDDFLHESEAQDQIDETHVVVLTAFNFSTFLASHRHVITGPDLAPQVLPSRLRGKFLYFFPFPSNIEHMVELLSVIRRCTCRFLAGHRWQILFKVMLFGNMVRINNRSFHAIIAIVQRRKVVAHGLNNT